MSSKTPPSAICDLCSGLYVDPRMLPCLHTFCIKCLKNIWEEQGSGTNLNCPTCEKTDTLPEGGVHTIQKDIRSSHEADVARLIGRMQSEEKKSCDFCINTSAEPAVSFCHDCNSFLCKAWSSYHKTCRVFLSHKLESLSKSKSKSVVADIQHKPVNCQLHENEILKFYCKNCSSLICCNCMTSEHAGHVHHRIEEIIIEKEKADLHSVIASTDIVSIMAELDDRIAKGSALMQEAGSDSQKPIEELIESTFTALTDTLSKRRESLLGKLSSIKTDLVVQVEEFQALRKDIVETCEMITTAAEVYSPAEMLSVKGAMKKKLEQLLKQYGETYLEPCKSDNILSKLDTSELVEDITTFGLIIKGSDPANAETGFYTRKAAVIGKERKTTITSYDVHRRRFPYGGENVKVSLSWPGGCVDDIEGEIVDNKDGTYVASFTPQEKCGIHKLSITFDGQHIKGSPFDVHVREAIDYRMVSNQVSFSLSYQSHAYDVAVADNGDVYVASYKSGIIEVFNSQGRQIRIIGAMKHDLMSQGQGQFHSPSAIAIQGDILYVAEDTNHCVHKLTTSGKLISKFGSHGSADGQLNKPRGLCLHSDGRVFVSDCGNKRISVFDASGAFLYHITGGAIYTYLEEPWGLTFDPSGNLHVADASSNSIKVFNAQGNYITQYSSVVAQPAGITIDEEGNTFVAENALYYGSNHGSYYSSYYDRRYSRLCILSSQQQVLHTLTIAQNATGIAIDKDGSIYACNGSTCYVQKFSAADKNTSRSTW